MNIRLKIYWTDHEITLWINWFFIWHNKHDGSKCRNEIDLKCITFTEMLMKFISEWNDASYKKWEINNLLKESDHI